MHRAALAILARVIQPAVGEQPHADSKLQGTINSKVCDPVCQLGAAETVKSGANSES
jgi:hypothetical protein